MLRLLWVVGVLSLLSIASAAEPPKLISSGLKNPAAVAVAIDGKTYLAAAGELRKDGDGEVLEIDSAKGIRTITKGLNDPTALAVYQDFLFVTDRDRILRINRRTGGEGSVYAAAKVFPRPPVALQAVTVDAESGTVYVADAGNGQGQGETVFRIHPKGKIDIVLDKDKLPSLQAPTALLMDGASHLLLLDGSTGVLSRVKLSNGNVEKIAEGFQGGQGLTWDRYGRLFLASSKEDGMAVIPRPGDKPVAIAGSGPATAVCLDATNKLLLIANKKAGTLSSLPAAVPNAPVDESPLAVESTVAFPELQWTGWKSETDRGKQNSLRPIVLTHAGDGSNRIFVATQHGVIHVFPNEPNPGKTKVFLDMQERVSYNDNQNEEGFLGLAFHPDYKKTGEFFVFYTVKQPKLTNVVSRFRVSKDDPNRADPTSEEEILRFTKPFWNHDGGTICFGPDGYLYIAHGDGGAANDPFNNGQNLKTLLGKILRIDINQKQGDLKYTIPADNPFVKQSGARPEVYAYGLRNVWRMAFDRKTGALWAGDVGQNLYEEIDLITPGGNYGWRVREGLHPFGAEGTGSRKDLIDPIWEYHHDVGKSITGGTVYRGTRLPELQGHYIYADYVSGRIWGLRYDETAKRVAANRPIRGKSIPVMSFGEDEQGEIYFMTYSPFGQGIFQFAKMSGR